MRSLAGEPDLHKKWLLFLPSGHKEKLGQGSKELGFARPNHSGLGHLVKKKKKISQFGPLHFTSRFFNSGDNDNFQATISELAEQTSKMHQYRGRKPTCMVGSVHNHVLERQHDWSFSQDLKAEPPSKEGESLLPSPLPWVCTFNKSLDSSFCSTSWWASLYALSGETNKKQTLRARSNLKVLRLSANSGFHCCLINCRYFLLCMCYIKHCLNSIG